MIYASFQAGPIFPNFAYFFPLLFATLSKFPYFYPFFYVTGHLKACICNSETAQELVNLGK